MKNGDELEAVVLSIDRNEKKMSLGVKQLSKDPWSDKKLLEKVFCWKHSLWFSKESNKFWFIS